MFLMLIVKTSCIMIVEKRKEREVCEIVDSLCKYYEIWWENNVVIFIGAYSI